MDSPLNIVMVVWFGLTAVSLAYVLYDMATNTPLLGVMRLAWVLILLYTGPVGLVVYILSCRKPAGMSHAEFIKPHWKQAVGSMIHCIAGDATGIILAATLVYAFGLPNGIDLVVEYVGAFIVGLFIFQALFMLNMYGNYWTAVRKTFFAETVSMNMVMTGMFPAMIVLKHWLPSGEDPLHPLFWFIMSMATLVSALTAYPINSWMVGRGIKHGMMSPPEKGAPAAAGHGAMDHGDMPGMAHEGMDSASHDMAGMKHEAHAGGGMKGMDHGAHAGHALSFGVQLGLIVATFAVMIGVIAVVGLFVPIRFS